jgi:hypothetical protein
MMSCCGIATNKIKLTFAYLKDWIDKNMLSWNTISCTVEKPGNVKLYLLYAFKIKRVVAANNNKSNKRAITLIWLLQQI